MRIYTSEDIYEAVSNTLNNVPEATLRRWIDKATVDAYLNAKPYAFLDFMKIVYEYYNDPNYDKLYEQLNRIYEQDIPELNFEDDNFEI